MPSSPTYAALPDRKGAGIDKGACNMLSGEVGEDKKEIEGECISQLNITPQNRMEGHTTKSILSSYCVFSNYTIQKDTIALQQGVLCRMKATYLVLVIGLVSPKRQTTTHRIGVLVCRSFSALSSSTTLATTMPARMQYSLRRKTSARAYRDNVESLRNIAGAPL